MLGKVIRFGISGVITTSMAYLTFRAVLAAGAHYLLAAFGSWVCSIGVGFLLNRYLTFQIRGAQDMGRQGISFVVGGILQLTLGLIGYSILIGYLGLAPTPAFCANLLITTAFSFTFLNLVTFRKV